MSDQKKLVEWILGDIAKRRAAWHVDLENMCGKVIYSEILKYNNDFKMYFKVEVQLTHRLFIRCGYVETLIEPAVCLPEYEKLCDEIETIVREQEQEREECKARCILDNLTKNTNE